MNDPYDEDDYDDQYDYDDNDQHDPYKFYFKFDIGNTPISDWFQKTISDIVNNSYDTMNIPGFPVQKFPVSSWNPNTGKGKTFQYLGSNYNGEPIWKSKYWIIDPLNQEYTLHLQSHAAHFIQQPQYYKSMFDILN